ncbi:DUF6471 domain-containing protein [Caballeronia sp. LjRoot34]|uniref:DUF6471 domain-containing protein n=1 Tax=Caballeronia sp. LjRoot34 TaxID=3342325 RepID=UPI003ED0092B
MIEGKSKEEASAESFDLRSEAKLALKYEIQRRGLTYKQVGQKLRERGWNETDSSIAQRIARGTFRLTFFMAVMISIGATEVSIRLPKDASLEKDLPELEAAD